jgi:hypothetical protein
MASALLLASVALISTVGSEKERPPTILTGTTAIPVGDVGLPR